MMGRTVRRFGTAALVILTAFGAAGCFPSRAEVFSELHSARRHAYARWRGEVDEDDLVPRIDGDLTVDEAIRLALEYNPRFQSVLQERVKAKGRVYQAYAEALPTVKLSAGYTRLDEGPILGTANDLGDRDNYSYQVNVTQPLFKGGSIGAALKGATYYRFLSDEAVRQSVQDLALQAARSYYEVVLAEELVAVQTEALELAEANLKDVTAREHAGVAIPFDRLRARVEVSNVEADLIQQRNRLNRARATLFRLMGVSQKSEVSYVSELTYVPLDADFEKTVEAALLNRPELFRGELDVLVQRAALRIVMADYLPSLEAWYMYKWAKPDPHNSARSTWDHQWQAGLQLAWTLFDGLRREGAVIQQRAVLQQSLLELAETEQKVFEEIKSALFDLADADKLVDSQQENMDLAAKALDLVRIGAREGVNTELEVLDARSALTKARGNYYMALHAHLEARLILQRVVGMLGPPPGTPDVPAEAPSTEMLNLLVRDEAEAAPEAAADGPADAETVPAGDAEGEVPAAVPPAEEAVQPAADVAEEPTEGAEDPAAPAPSEGEVETPQPVPGADTTDGQ